MIRRILTALVVIVTMLSTIFISSLAYAQVIQPVTLKLAHYTATSHTIHVNAQFFADAVSKRSGGKVKIQIYPAASLIKGPDVLYSVQKGIVDLGIVNPNYQSSDLPFPAAIGDIPFGWHSSDMAKIWEIAMPIWARNLVRFNQTALYGNSLTTDFFFVKAIDPDNPSFAGRRVRGMGPATTKEIELFGGLASAIAIGEVSMAISTGGLDGVYTSWDFVVGSKWTDTLKYLYKSDGWSILANVVTINNDSLNKLQPEVKAILMDAAKETQSFANTSFIASRESFIKQAKAMPGINVIELTNAQRAIWRQKLMPRWTDFKKQFGAQADAFIQAVEKATGEKIIQ